MLIYTSKIRFFACFDPLEAVTNVAPCLGCLGYVSQ